VLSPFIGFRVGINGVESDKEWVGLHLNMATSKHVVGYATLRHYLGKNSVMSGRTFYKKNSQFSVQFGEYPAKGKSRTFHGYITNHKVGDPDTDENGPYVEVSYFLIGTSEPMQAKNSGTYKTWSSAARAIASRNKVKAVVHATPVLAKPIVQTGSDFTFLAQGAAETGFRFFAQGSTLYFINPLTTLTSRLLSTPVFEGPAIGKFHVEASEEDQNTVWEVHGTTPKGKAIVLRSTPATTTDIDGPLPRLTVRQDASVVTSLAEAQAALDKRTMANKMWVHATVDTVGDARVIPGKVVYLDADDIPDDHRGLWLVDKVVHDIDISDSQDLDTYSLDMELSRDRLGPVYADLPWGAIDFAANSADVNEEDVISINGRWQASFHG
jgi:hypothetical protein